VAPEAKKAYLERLKQMLETPPPRLGAPLNPLPSRMEKIWKA